MEASVRRHSLIYAVNVGTHKKTAESENCQGKLRLLSSTKGKGEENRIEL